MSVSPRHLRIHRYAALEAGPRLIVTGAVHGNETAGTRGIERVRAEIEAGEFDIVRGAVSFVAVTNPLAYVRCRREGERNLNRRLQPTATPQDNEDRIANLLCPLLAAHDVLLDLHSFRSPGQPFALRGPADNRGTLEPFAHEQAEARLAAHLGVTRIVDGWLDAYAEGVARRRERALTPGAVHEDPAYGVGSTEYMRSVGGCAVTLECGQHDDAGAPEVARHAIRQALALLGIADLPLAPARGPFECLTLAAVVDRHAEGDRFVRSWRSFDVLAAGEPIARRADGSEVRAPAAGYIVFPDHGARPGHEWFYLARPSTRTLSAPAPAAGRAG
ncbi:MAG TPA: succinylglutamate desuccinylase/aspartoacylase family protein [Rubrivivax sp.]|nr:succinylglutamate desuccinylase/aspartoacylase family protein [Pseudomonadota bacterium]HPP83970.1 succinylglutamate desuccinylase/aspartoacylase family protein [Rubrivivax sp.]